MIKLLALDYDWTMLDYSAGKPAFSQELLDYLTRFIAAGGIAGIVSGRTEDSLRHEAFTNGWAWEAPFPSFCVLQEAYAKVPRDALADLNLQNRAKINALSRRFCAGALTLAEFRTALQVIRDERPTPAWQELLLYMVISFSLSIFFGGNLADGIAASLSGMVLFAMIRMSTTLQMNSLLQTAICSAVTALAVLLLVRAGIGVHPDKIMIGNIMLVIPGIQLTTSLRDMINGDTISGLLNLSEAVLKAISVALGFSLVLLAGGV